MQCSSDDDRRHKGRLCNWCSPFRNGLAAPRIIAGAGAMGEGGGGNDHKSKLTVLIEQCIVTIRSGASWTEIVFGDGLRVRRRSF